MTEWEKMCAGRLYDAGCEALAAARTACKDLCHAYNLCLPSDTARRRGSFCAPLLARWWARRS